MRTFLLSLCLAPLALLAQDHSDALVKWTMLDANTFHDPQTAAYINAHFHPVKFDAEGGEPAVYNGKTYTNPATTQP